MKKWLRFLMVFLPLLVLIGCGTTASQVPLETTTGLINRTLEFTETKQADEELEIIEENNASRTIPLEDSEADLPEDGVYSSKDEVARYLYLYGHLPSNFITKKEAEELGWQGGSLESFASGMCIGGSRFGNYEGLLPKKKGRFYTECDIDTLGAEKRGAKRIVFSNDGLIYYTEDHYKTFELLYGDE